MIKFWKGSVPETVIISPIDAVVRKLYSSLEDRRIIGASPWYYSVKGSFRGRRTAIINCGRGESAGDCVLFLGKEAIKKLIFCGFAGSIRKSFRPGDICAAVTASGGCSFSDFINITSGELPCAEKIWKPGCADEGLKKANIYTVPSLFAQDRFYGILEKKGYDLVDMETAHILAAGGNMKKSFFYYVTDYRMEFKKINLNKITALCLQSV